MVSGAALDCALLRGGRAAERNVRASRYRGRQFETHMRKDLLAMAGQETLLPNELSFGLLLIRTNAAC